MMKWDRKEKRRFVRADLPCKIEVYVPKQRVFNTHTENISEGGVRVILENKIEVFSIVGLEVYLGKEPIICKGRVVWVIEKANPVSEKILLYDIGIEFYEIKEEDKHIIKNFVESVVSGEK
jgi:c-di-GMP-binding flagellar brake protein YcgR